MEKPIYLKELIATMIKRYKGWMLVIPTSGLLCGLLLYQFVYKPSVPYYRADIVFGIDGGKNKDFSSVVNRERASIIAGNEIWHLQHIKRGLIRSVHSEPQAGDTSFLVRLEVFDHEVLLPFEPVLASYLKANFPQDSSELRIIHHFDYNYVPYGKSIIPVFLYSLFVMLALFLMLLWRLSLKQTKE